MQTKDYTLFLSSVICVKNVHPLIIVIAFVIVVIIVVGFVIVVVLVVALSCVFHFFFCLFLQVTLTTKIPHTFTVTNQSHTRPITF